MYWLVGCLTQMALFAYETSSESIYKLFQIVDTADNHSRIRSSNCLLTQLMQGLQESLYQLWCRYWGVIGHEKGQLAQGWGLL